MRLLTITNLYPSEARPRHGIFVEERLRHLVRSGELEARVLALRPAPPWVSRPVEPAEVRYGIPVAYQRVPTLPGATNWVDPLLWARAIEPVARRLVAGGDTGVIVDGHFLYPDAVAAVLLAVRLGLPAVMTARGSDVNVKCTNPVMRTWIRWAARRCAALITVSRALAERLEQFGVRPPMVEVLPNGVDVGRFRVADRSESQRRLGLELPNPGLRVLVSVGHLVPEKGHHIAIDALVTLPGTFLVVVGDGPERARLEQRAARRGVADRVRFLGLVPPLHMPDVYAAADVLVLPSAREGMPNVVLESLACGTRVVATAVGGIGEVVTAPAAGELIAERTPEALAAAVRRVLEMDIAVADTRAFAEKLGWAPIVERQIALYRHVLAGRSVRSATSAAGAPSP